VVLTFGGSWRFWGIPRLTYKHFTQKEVKGLDVPLVQGADRARDSAGIPFILTSTVRTPNFKDPNAVRDSAHIPTGDPPVGHAFDVRCMTDNELFLMLRGLLGPGRFRRTGIYFRPDPRGGGLLMPTHLHVDNDKTKTQDVVFCSMEA